MTLAAIDRLVHHATVLAMNVESYWRRETIERRLGRGRPPANVTYKKPSNTKADCGFANAEAASSLRKG
jgi:hypothetical protein